MSLFVRVIQNPKRAFKALAHRLVCLVGHADYTRFIVLTRSRTGSNMLLSFLRSHPNVAADGEILKWLEGRRAKQILQNTFAKQPPWIKAKGFKLFYYHPQDDASGRLWRELAEMSDLRVIHLKRWNILRTLVSRKIAEFQDVWQVRSRQEASAQTHTPKVRFDPDELKQKFAQTQRWQKEADRWFDDHSLLDVDYRDLVEAPTDEFSRVTAFLDLPFVPPATRLEKQNPEPLPELVANYHELKAVFRRTRWEAFFES
jgi:LPS sulfotransferase NodH